MFTASVSQDPPVIWPRLLQVGEVCTILGITRANFYGHVERGSFPFKPVRLGKSMRFRESDVLAFVNGETSAQS